MDALEACVSCRRYIKRAETSCPFCRSAHAPSLPVPWQRTPRVSRAAWLAGTLASSLVLGGCGGGVVPDPQKGEPYGTTSNDKTNEPLADAAGEEDGEVQFPSEAGVDEATLLYDAGEFDSGYDAGWHTCYGAPPARRERVATG